MSGRGKGAARFAFDLTAISAGMWVLLVCACFLAFTFTGTASATISAEVNGGELLVEATAGVNNNIEIYQCSGNPSRSWCIKDPNDKSVSAGSNCEVAQGFVGPDPKAVDGLRCAAGSSVKVRPDDGDDRVAVQAAGCNCQANGDAPGLTPVDIDGGPGNDPLLSGGLDPDTIIGGPGNDTINGRSGNDTLKGGDGLDIVYGEDGNDTIEGGANTDNLYGGAHDDCMNGNEGDDYVAGQAGNDVCPGGAAGIAGGAGHDEEWGGDGSDKLAGSADNDLIDGDGTSGSSGSDTVTYDDSGHVGGVNVSVNVGLGNDGSPGEGDTVRNVEVAVGTDNDDFFSGDQRAQRFVGLDGIDIARYDEGLHNGGVNASIGDGANDGSNFGAEGDDLDSTINGIIGSPGADSLYACSASTLVGGPCEGISSLSGLGGDDDLFGGDLDDDIEGGSGEDLIDGGGGADAINGGDDNDTINGGDDPDAIDGGNGDDTIDGGAGDDTIYGEEGNDTVDGGPDADIIDDAGGDDILGGGSGPDTIFGGNGNDSMVGDDGDDNLYGEADMDTARGDEGADYMDGGESGNDYDFIDYRDAGDSLQCCNGDGNDGVGCAPQSRTPCEHDTVLNFENNKAGEHADSLISPAGPGMTFEGGGGNDFIVGGTKNDVLFGEAGNDTIFGGDGTDWISGGEGTDNLYARDGFGDVLDGGSGDDFAQIDAFDANVGAIERGNAVVDYRNGTVSVADAPGASDTIGVSTAVDGRVRVSISGRQIDLSGGCTLSSGAALCPAATKLVVNGADGDDTISDGGLASATILVGTGGPGTDHLNGHPGTDVFDGGTGNDTLRGVDHGSADTDDVLTGGAGNDFVYGGNGGDTIMSGGLASDTDQYFGEGGDDKVYGGPGVDLITGGHGNDTMNGGDGNDGLDGRDWSSDDELKLEERDYLYCGAGTDTYRADQQDRSSGAVTECENDLEAPPEDPASNKTVATATATASQVTYTAKPGFANKVKVVKVGSNFEIKDTKGKVEPGVGCQAKTGTPKVALCPAKTKLSADLGDGRDVFKSASLDSTIATTVKGGDGKDKLVTGDGNDTLQGGPGADNMNGGPGSDTISYAEKTAPVDVYLAQPSTSHNGETSFTLNTFTTHGAADLEGDVISWAESAIGGYGADILQGNQLDNTLEGGAGADAFSGGPGSDTIKAKDGTKDPSILCGDGFDHYQVDAVDPITANSSCESAS